MASLALAAIALQGCAQSGDRSGQWSDWFTSEGRLAIPDSVTPLLVAHALGRTEGPETTVAHHSGETLVRRYLGTGVITVAAGAAAVEGLDAHIQWLRRVPYWVSLRLGVGGVTPDGFLAAGKIAYPIYVYDASRVLRDSITSPPDSWRRPRPPERGEFPPERRAAWLEYLQGLTVIAGLAGLDGGVIVVAHGRFSGRPDDRDGIIPTAADLYYAREKIAEDIPTPGLLLAYGRRSVFLWEDGGVTEYTWIGR